MERGNQARQSDFSGAADRLRKLSTAEYEARRLPAPSCCPSLGTLNLNSNLSPKPADHLRKLRNANYKAPLLLLLCSSRHAAST